MIKTSLAVMFTCLGLCSCLTTGNTTVTDREQEGQPTQQIEEMAQQPAETTENALETPGPGAPPKGGGPGVFGGRYAQVGRRDTDAGCTVMHGVVAERTNILARGVHGQQCVIYMGEYFSHFHKTTSFVVDGFSIPQKRARYQSPGASSSGVYSKISPG